MANWLGQYEQQFARVSGSSYARALSLGRMGLYAVLKALDLPPGSRVGVCGYTCLSVAEAVLRAGLRCEFLDVDEWLNIDPAALDRPGVKLDALITQYTFGVCSQLDATLAWAERHNVPVIEDCCHALGSQWAGRPVGSFGVAAIYSTEWGKSYSTGQGGLLTVNDGRLAGKIEELLTREAHAASGASDLSLAVQRLLRRTLVGPRTYRSLRHLYRAASKRGLVRGSFREELDFSDSRDFLQRPGAMLARAGLRQLRNWPRLQQQRKSHAQLLRQRLREAGIDMPPYPPQADPTPTRLAICVKDKATVLACAAQRHAEIAGWYDSVVHPLHGKQLTQLGYAGQCPVSQSIIARLVHLPTYPALTERQVSTIIDILRWSGRPKDSHGQD